MLVLTSSQSRTKATVVSHCGASTTLSHILIQARGPASAVTHHHLGGPQLTLGRVPTRSASSAAHYKQVRAWLTALCACPRIHNVHVLTSVCRLSHWCRPLPVAAGRCWGRHFGCHRRCRSLSPAPHPHPHSHPHSRPHSHLYPLLTHTLIRIDSHCCPQLSLTSARRALHFSRSERGVRATVRATATAWVRMVLSRGGAGPGATVVSCTARGPNLCVLLTLHLVGGMTTSIMRP